MNSGYVVLVTRPGGNEIAHGPFEAEEAESIAAEVNMGQAAFMGDQPLAGTTARVINLTSEKPNLIRLKKEEIIRCINILFDR